MREGERERERKTFHRRNTRQAVARIEATARVCRCAAMTTRLPLHAGCNRPARKHAQHGLSIGRSGNGIRNDFEPGKGFVRDRFRSEGQRERLLEGGHSLRPSKRPGDGNPGGSALETRHIDPDDGLTGCLRGELGIGAGPGAAQAYAAQQFIGRETRACEVFLGADLAPVGDQLCIRSKQRSRPVRSWISLCHGAAKRASIADLPITEPARKRCEPGRPPAHRVRIR